MVNGCVRSEWQTAAAGRRQRRRCLPEPAAQDNEKHFCATARECKIGYRLEPRINFYYTCKDFIEGRTCLLNKRSLSRESGLQPLQTHSPRRETIY